MPEWFDEYVSISPEPEIDRIPWLTRNQQDRRLAMGKRLTAHLERTDVAPPLKQKLREAIDIVDELEKDILNTDALLKDIRTRPMCSDAWLELSDLHARHHKRLPEILARLQDRLSHLVAIGGLSQEDSRLFEESLQRLGDTHAYLFSDDLPWADISRRLETGLRTVHGRNAVVFSRVLPPSVFEAHLPQGTGAKDRTGATQSPGYGQTTVLEWTTLDSYAPAHLFEALRHSVIHAEDLDPRQLAGRSEDQLRTLVGDLLLPRLEIANETRSHEQLIAHHCREIRAGGNPAQAHAEAMQRQAYRNLAREIIAATLVIDPERFEDGLAGETEKLSLFNIALLTPEDLPKYSYQQAAFAYFDEPSSLPDSQRTPVALRVRDPHGEPRIILAKVQVRQFALSANGEPLQLEPRARDMQAKAVERLLGPTASADLGGEVRARVDAWRAQISSLRPALEELRQPEYAPAPNQGLSQFAAETASRLLVHECNLNQRERSVIALEEAGRQLKAMWRRERDWPAGIDASRQAAARLALIAFLMGHETPVLSCAKGKDFTRALDAEIKFLATVADALEGYVPPADRLPDALSPIRAAFTPQ